ncbi:hypothetical protein ATKI12_5757 [Kitasatospora sp. Ki12]
MPGPLASVDQLTARLGYPLTGPDLTMAEAALADASAVVRAHGLAWPDPARVPDVVRSVVLAAAERRVRNPEGYRMEQQGSYSYQLPASTPLGVDLTTSEVRLIRGAAGVAGGVYSVPIAGLGGSL